MNVGPLRLKNQARYPRPKAFGLPQRSVRKITLVSKEHHSPNGSLSYFSNECDSLPRLGLGLLGSSDTTVGEELDDLKL